MRKKLLKPIVLIFVTATLITLQSCEKKEMNIEKENPGKEYSFLEFADQETFTKAFESQDYSSKPANFISMYDIYIKISETIDPKEKQALIEKYKNVLSVDEDGIVSLIIHDDIAASFLSPEGLIKIGNEISLVKKDKIVTLTNGDVSKIDLLFQFDQDSPENHIRIDEYYQIAEKAYWEGYDKWNNEEYKLTWEKWAEYGSIFSSSAGGKVKSYKKTWAGYVPRYTTLAISVHWDYIEWGKDNTVQFWNAQTISSSDPNGWTESVQKNQGTGWTPNPVYGLVVSGSVGGHSFSH